MFCKISKYAVPAVMLTSSYALLVGCSSLYNSSIEDDLQENEIVIENAVEATSKKDINYVKIEEKQKTKKIKTGEGLVADISNRQYDDEYSRKKASVIRPLLDEDEIIEQVEDKPKTPEAAKVVLVDTKNIDEIADDTDNQVDELFDDEKQSVKASVSSEDQNEKELSLEKEEFDKALYASDLDKLLKENKDNLEKLSSKIEPKNTINLIPPSRKVKVDRYKVSYSNANMGNAGKVNLINPATMMSPMIVSGANANYNPPSNILPRLDVQTYGTSFDMAVPAQVVIDNSGAREMPQNTDNYMSGNAGISFLVSTIYHRHGSDRLSDDDMRKIFEAANMAAKYNGKLRIVGHASSRTREMPLVQHMMINFNMSMKRAQKVSRVLVDAGFPQKNLYVNAVSDAEPIYYEVMPSGEAGNRRTEIYLDY